MKADQLKVLVLSTVFPNPDRAVFGLFVFERIRAMAAVADVRVIAPTPWFHRPVKRCRKAARGLAVIHPRYFYLPGLGKVFDGVLLFLSVIVLAVRLRRRFPFTLIDAHFGHPDGLAAILLGKCFSCPVVITLRGSEIDHAQFLLRRWTLRWTLRRADRVIAVSEELAALARNYGVPADRITVIENGVDVRRFVPIDPQKARVELGLTGRSPIVTSVGHLIPRKGFHRLLEVLPVLRAKYPQLLLCIVGGAAADDPYARKLHALVAEHGLEDTVRFAGARPPSELSAWLSAADLFVLASAREGCPNVVLEAMACGVPVVSTRVGEVDRIVPAHAGLLADNADSPGLEQTMLKALDTRWDRTAIRTYMEQRTWQSVASRVLVQWQLAAARTGSAAVQGGAVRVQQR